MTEQGDRGCEHTEVSKEQTRDSQVVSKPGVKAQRGQRWEALGSQEAAWRPGHLPDASGRDAAGETPPLPPNASALEVTRADKRARTLPRQEKASVTVSSLRPHAPFFSTAQIRGSTWPWAPAASRAPSVGECAQRSAVSAALLVVLVSLPPLLSPSSVFSFDTFTSFSSTGPPLSKCDLRLIPSRKQNRTDIKTGSRSFEIFILFERQMTETQRKGLYPWDPMSATARAGQGRSQRPGTPCRSPTGQQGPGAPASPAASQAHWEEAGWEQRRPPAQALHMAWGPPKQRLHGPKLAASLKKK